MKQNNNMLNELPDEVFELIYKNVYNNTLNELKEKVNDKMGLKYYEYLKKPKDEIIPSCDLFYAKYREENSDDIRNRYLKNTYENIEKKGKGRRTQLDYWKLICDLERPTVWPNSWNVRKYLSSGQFGKSSGINWGSTYEPAKTTDAGWKRLVK